MARILILGATGYVGGHLVPLLVRGGHRLRCLVRRPERFDRRDKNIEVVAGDVLKQKTLTDVFEDIDIVYYLIHSMTAGERDFEERDRRAAVNVGRAARAAGVKRIIYLGGLGRRGEETSPHLRSRHEVGTLLRESGVPVTEFRAAVIVGSGSSSFEMVHHLVNRLPLMICPRWVMTRTQPIALEDVLKYLVACVDYPDAAGRSYDIGGPEVLTYRNMMLTVARVLGLRRYLLRVPVLTPRLSSYWVDLVTPVPASLARALIEGVRSETVCEDERALQEFKVRPVFFEEAVRKALQSVLFKAGDSLEGIPDGDHTGIDPSHFCLHRTEIDVNAPSDRVWTVVEKIGGTSGWYYADWLWRLRGFVDRLFGGVGLRRGPNLEGDIRRGDEIDFWRVEKYIKGRLILLRAEMKVWGQAWLKFEVTAVGEKRSHLIQTARYYPRGLFGLVYWYGIYPLHAIVFKGMAAAVRNRAEIARPRDKTGVDDD